MMNDISWAFAKDTGTSYSVYILGAADIIVFPYNFFFIIFFIIFLKISIISSVNRQFDLDHQL